MPFVSGDPQSSSGVILMGSDLIVAMPETSANQSTYFGINSHRPLHEVQTLVVNGGSQHSCGEAVNAQHIRLPQQRQTFAVLGSQPENCWGYLYGVNERCVAIGYSHWDSLLTSNEIGLLGTDIVRLCLERSASAQQAADLMIDFIYRYGQSRFAGLPSAKEEGHIFLIADAKNAFVIEAADHYWAMQEIHSVRAVSDVSMIRQDWNRIAPGLAEQAISQGLWQCDGNKLDFGCLNKTPAGSSSALRRWGRATLLLESQSGAIDGAFIRKVLSDHYEETSFEIDPTRYYQTPNPICQHDFGHGTLSTATSFQVELSEAQLEIPMAWVTFGPPCFSVSFPVFLLPNALPLAFNTPTHEFRPGTLWHASQQLQDYLQEHPEGWDAVRERLAYLQTRIDQDTEDFTYTLGRGKLAMDGELPRSIQRFMRKNLEMFDNMLLSLVQPRVEDMVAG